jgi:hypothetical protein
MQTSSTKTRSRSLAHHSAQKLKNFLAHLANLPDQADARDVHYFKRHFGELFLPEVPWSVVDHWAIRVEEEDVVELSKDERLWKYWLVPLRNAVRVIWVSPDLRIKQWGVFRVLEKYFLVGDRSLSVGPVHDDSEWFVGHLGPPSFCESAMLQLVRFARLTKLCVNPGCQTPYFLASRQSQQYCSEPCALPAQRKSQRKWWAANGPDWRRSRRAKSQNRPQKNSTPVPRSCSRTEERVEKKGGKHGTRKTR